MSTKLKMFIIPIHELNIHNAPHKIRVDTMVSHVCVHRHGCLPTRRFNVILFSTVYLILSASQMSREKESFSEGELRIRTLRRTVNQNLFRTMFGKLYTYYIMWYPP